MSMERSQTSYLLARTLHASNEHTPVLARHTMPVIECDDGSGDSTDVDNGRVLGRMARFCRVRSMLISKVAGGNSNRFSTCQLLMVFPHKTNHG
jgi:hypothetical protein